MVYAKCHAEGCNKLMVDHSAQEHFKCSMKLVKEMEKKKKK
jgi:hypothetical protein